MFEPAAAATVAHRYRLVREIGRGGMGAVWEAIDLELDAPCALKFILNQSNRPPEVRSRFLREARAVARLQSPHVVSVRGVGEWEGALYIAMELLVGETLFERLTRTGTLSAEETTRVVSQVASVLNVAHSMGIVHRDLKPENIWLWSQGELFVKLLDFGVAKHVLDETLLKTATGVLVGTPYYMSPEQAAGDRHVDHRTDLWSLGVIAAECLGGSRPIQSTGLGQVLANIINGAIPPISTLYPQSTPALEQWWTRATAKQSAQRYDSAQTLARDFALALGLRPVWDVDEAADVNAAETSNPAAVRGEALGATSSLSPLITAPLTTQAFEGAVDLWPEPAATVGVPLAQTEAEAGEARSATATADASPADVSPAHVSPAQASTPDASIAGPSTTAPSAAPSAAALATADLPRRAAREADKPHPSALSTVGWRGTWLALLAIAALSSGVWLMTSKPDASHNPESSAREALVAKPLAPVEAPAPAVTNLNSQDRAAQDRAAQDRASDGLGAPTADASHPHSVNQNSLSSSTRAASSAPPLVSAAPRAAASAPRVVAPVPKPSPRSKPKKTTEPAVDGRIGF